MAQQSIVSGCTSLISVDRFLNSIFYAILIKPLIGHQSFLNTWNLEFGAWNFSLLSSLFSTKPRLRSSAIFKYLEFGIWCLEFGT